MQDNPFSRRQFMGGVVASVSAAALAERVVAQTSSASATGIPTRPLGKTGARVSIIGVGGGHAQRLKDQAEYNRFAHMAVDEGITFFDNAWDYGDGVAEEMMGKALAEEGYRKKVFLMTKDCGRDYKQSMVCLEDSLRRLQTDHIDLWQFHEINYDNDPDWIFERGAIKAAVEARKAGKVRFIGFTGHKDPHIQLKMLAKPFEWDTCMIPINVVDAHFRSFQKSVVPVCLKRGISVIGFKGLGGGAGMLLGKEGLTLEECLRYALSQPVVTQIVGMTRIDQLKKTWRLPGTSSRWRPPRRARCWHGSKKWRVTAGTKGSRRCCCTTAAFTVNSTVSRYNDSEVTRVSPRRKFLSLLVCAFFAGSLAYSQKAPKRQPDVHWEPTTDPVVTAMLKLAGVKKGDTVYDLGCGDGRIVIAAATQFGARGVGIDIDPQRIAESNENAKKAGVTNMVRFEEEDLFEAKISDATVVTLFLWPSVNMKLRPKLLKELKPGTRVVSHSHDMEDWKADKEEVVDGARLFLWTIGKSAPPNP
jgi:uncharacterized protein